jgi:hypothetical protein
MLRVLVIVALLAGACSVRSDLPSSGDAGQVAVVIEPTGQLDLLFMIDNSASPTGSKEFGRDVAVLLGELAALPGGGVDLHAGVISSDLGAGPMPLGNGSCARVGGDRGVLQTKSSCNLPGGQRYLSVAPGVLGSAALQLSCMMDLGVAGCGYEHQLAAVTTALDAAATPENAGFLRPDAHLAVVIVTDEDDCSAPPDTGFFAQDMPGQTSSARCALAGHLCGGVHPPAAPFTAPLVTCEPAKDGPLIPVQTLVDRVRASKRDPDRQLTVAAMFGDPAAHPGLDYRLISTQQGVDYYSNCDTSLGTSVMGLRLASFVQSFGPAGASFDICTEDVVPTLRGIGRAIARRLTSACLPEPVLACEVTAGQPLPRCGPRTDAACWELLPDPRCLGSGTLLTIVGAGTLPGGTRVTARCQSSR